MGKRPFVVGESDVPTYELISGGWVVFLHEAVQRRGDSVPGFHFDWLHFPVFLDQELDLVLIIGPKVEKPMALLHQGFADDVLVDPPFGAAFEGVIEDGSLGLEAES